MAQHDATDRLAADIREATSDLLDLGLGSSTLLPSQSNGAHVPSQDDTAPRHALYTPSPFQLNSPPMPAAPTYRPESKLVRLDSSEDEAPGPSHRRPSEASKARTGRVREAAARPPTLWPAPRTDERTTIAIQSASADEHDWLPSGGLFSTVRSVHEETSLTPPPPFSAVQGSAAGRDGAGARTKSPHKDVHGALRDVWLNEFGERVINGQVVGQISAGRRRAESPLAALAPRRGTPSQDRREPPPSAPARMHSEDSPQSTPRFFLQSFPNAIPGKRQSIDLSDPQKESLAHSDSASSFMSAETAPRTSPPRKPPLRMASPQKLTATNVLTSPWRALMRASSPLAAAKSDVQARSDQSPTANTPKPKGDFGLIPPPSSASSPSAKQDSGDDVEDDSEVAEALESPPTARSEPQWTNLGLGMIGPMTLTQRANAVFNAPLVESGHASADEGDNNVARSVSMPSSPTPSWHEAAEADTPARKSHESDESLPSSLQSLPASIHTISSLAPSAMSDHSISRRRNGSRTSLTSGGSDNGVFAREVRIRGWSEVGDKARGWVVFHVRITTKQGTIITAHRRFSSFVTLRRQLTTERPEYARQLASLPGRRAGLFKYNAKQLEARRKALQTWLESVMLNPRWAECACLRSWLVDTG